MLNFHVYLEKHIYCQPRFHPFDRFVSPQLLNWLVFWLVHHTRYRNRVHPLGTLFKVLKTSLLPFIARSIFRFVIFILSKTYFHHKTWLSGHMSTLWASSSHAKVSFESSFSTSARTFPQKGFSPASFSFHPFGRIVSPKQSLNGRIMLLLSSCYLSALITWILCTFMDCLFMDLKSWLWCDFLIALITGIPFIFMALYIVELEIRLFFRLLFTQFTWVSDSFMARFPVESNSFFIFELIIALITWISYTYMDYIFVSFSTG